MKKALSLWERSKFPKVSEMYFLSFLVGLSLIICAIGAPISIFLVKPTKTSWVKSGKLLLPTFIFSLTTSFTALSDCIPYSQIGCYLFKMHFITLGMLLYTMYLGWFEFLWRIIHKQITWPLKENLKYGIVSNIVIIVSGFMTLLWIIKPAFEYIGSAILD